MYKPVSDSRISRGPRFTNGGSRRRRGRLRHEQLEARYLLAAEFGSDDLSLTESRLATSAPAITWVETYRDVPRIKLDALPSVDPVYPDGFIGPKDLATGEWIVQLNRFAADRLRTLSAADQWLDDGGHSDFTVIRGLGATGLVHVRGRGLSQSAIESSLAANEYVESFALNTTVQGQAVPNDPDVNAGVMVGLESLGAESAWDVSVGTSRTVVGVVDSGVDATHPDLFLNIWLNQGEIPVIWRDGEMANGELQDIDSDGLITFYDLNNLRRTASGIVVAQNGNPTTPETVTTMTPYADGLNAAYVTDSDLNGRIDAQDLLRDGLWTQGDDNDGNGYFDDIFGWNFRAGTGDPNDPSDDDPFALNDPSDQTGHGTHVAGTIGAVGDNGVGIAGVNWQTSIMSLRILDHRNRSDAASALAAVNYARVMRERLAFNEIGRTIEGANVRVLNNSWGQTGGFLSAFESAITDLGDAGILFVAAAGNGDIFGNGVDNDMTPFYPASYDADNLIAVGAHTADNRIADFSNFGKLSVDLFAPGVGIHSTRLDGRYDSANGTSMATPHVAGTAALIWSALPEATVAEVREAILSTTIPLAFAEGIHANSRRLDASGAINADVFHPSARLINAPNITTSGGTAATFDVVYEHANGFLMLNFPSGYGEIKVTRGWGEPEELIVTGDFIDIQPPQSAQPTSVTVRYTVTPPGGTWDALDYGDYVVSTVAGWITSTDGKELRARDIGAFNVRITNDPAVIVVGSFPDELGSPSISLRDAIIAANAAGAPRTIILDEGTYSIDIAHQPDASVTFFDPPSSNYCDAEVHTTGWSNETTGDFDITGSIAIVGDRNDRTVIDGRGLDRVFKVHPNALLELQRVTITGGVSPPDQGGGGILSAGDVLLEKSVVEGNRAVSVDPASPIRGGGIAAWKGIFVSYESWIANNESDFGGGLFYCGNVFGYVSRSTISDNVGGGLHSHSEFNDVQVDNSTFSNNSGGRGAVFAGTRDGFDRSNAESRDPSISADGRYVAFLSEAFNLVPGDTNGIVDVFVYDKELNQARRINVASDGSQANSFSYTLAMSSDGSTVAFESVASNLLEGQSTFGRHIYVALPDGQIELVSVNDDGIPGNASSSFPAISADGRFVAFWSEATNLVDDDTNFDLSTFGLDLFVRDRLLGTTERVSEQTDGTQATGTSFLSYPSISGDGQFVVFASDSPDLVEDDVNGESDIFLFDRGVQRSIQRISTDYKDAKKDADGPSWRPQISENGNFIVFDSDAENLISNDDNGFSDVYLFDRIVGDNQRVSLKPDGNEIAFGDSVFASISGDGQHISYLSFAFDLVPDDSNLAADVFVVDRTNFSSVRRVNLDRFERESDEGVDFFGASPVISADGSVVTFASSANDLIEGDKPQSYDVFLRDIIAGEISSATFQPSFAKINAEQITVANTSEAEFAVSGNVELRDALLTRNTTVGDIDFRVFENGNNLFSVDPGSDLIGDPKRYGTAPPVLPLLIGNPAIDGGDPFLSGTTDQLGTIRSGSPDVGAYEAVSGSFAGKVFVDFNQNQQLDPGEPGLAGVTVSSYYADGNSTGSTDTSRFDLLQTFGIDEEGSFELGDFSPGSYQFQIDPPADWSLSRPVIRRVQPLANQSEAESSRATVSRDGRFIAFESESTKFVQPDNNGSIEDVFLFDQLTGNIRRISENAQQVQANALSFDANISANGQVVAFQSYSSNLDPVHMASGIFVYDATDPQSPTVELVSVSDGRVSPANGFSSEPSVNADGRYVAFSSFATNLKAGVNNGVKHIYVFDRQNETIEHISHADGGAIGNGNSDFPSISADGRYVAYMSLSNNLVPGSFTSGIYLYDTVEETTIRITDGVNAPALSGDGNFVVGSDGIFWIHDRINDTTEFIVGGGSLSISADGRFVTFRTGANLVPDDTNGVSDVYVYDRLNPGEFRRVNVSRDGSEANNIVNFFGRPSISDDGRTVVFDSLASNLTPGDTNQVLDIFVASNPLAPASVTREVLVGDQIDDLHLGLVPNRGSISGTVFRDTVGNGVYDLGEDTLLNWTVFLDANFNGELDAGEISTKSDTNGAYEFPRLAGYRQYAVAVQPQIGYEQVQPGASKGFSHDVFLRPGGNVTARDFGFRQAAGSGQSSNSEISGRVYDDNNGNGIFDTGDASRANVNVYLDTNNNQVFDSGLGERRTVTNAQGLFSITGLSSQIVTVRTDFQEPAIHLDPRGSRFETASFLLINDALAGQTPISLGGDPQSAATADFNNDGFEDIAVLISDRNLMTIRLNDRAGGFPTSDLNINLAPSSNTQGVPVPGISLPKDLVLGQFNTDPRVDAAIAGFGSGKVLVLLDYDPVQNEFESGGQLISVGTNPIALALADFDGDSDMDLAVVNSGVPRLLSNNPPTYQKTGDETFQILTNNGGGSFTASPLQNVDGDNPSGIVVGNFDGDTNANDIAILHPVPSDSMTTSGSVALFLYNEAMGQFMPGSSHQVGAYPIDIAIDDLNGDGLDDLAVVNSTSISVLTGQVGGGLQLQLDSPGTGDGVDKIQIADIDGDGDNDLIASRLTSATPVAIFRNVSAEPGTVVFEPLEGAGQASNPVDERSPIVVANFDNDPSGTIDIVAVPKSTTNVTVLLNSFVNGGRRVVLDGNNTICDGDNPLCNLDFRTTSPPPSLDPIANPSAINEDAGQQSIQLTGIAKGRPSQTLRASAFSSNPAIVPDPTTIGYVDGNSTGTLYFTPAPNAVGAAVITVRFADDGADGEPDTPDDGSVERTFQVSVLPVNDPPTFTLLGDLVSWKQDAGPRTVDSFVTNISTGGGDDEASQKLNPFVVTAFDPSLFIAQPAIDVQGKLTFTPHSDRFGLALVEVRLSDNGGTANGGINQRTRFLVIDVLPVNDAPSITIGNDIAVVADVGPQMVPNFASNFDPGSGDDDATQLIADFVVSVDRPDLFSVEPDISNDGQLTFTPLPAGGGTAIVTVQVRDSGGQSNGGVDLSVAQTFNIIIDPANPTVNYVEVAGGSAQRSMVGDITFEFDKLVTVAADAFEVTKLGSGGGLVTTMVSTAEVLGRTRVRLTFTGPLTDGESLGDGNYEIRVIANRISGGGKPLDGGAGPGSDYVDYVFRLFGDEDANRSVNLLDFARFRQAFGSNSNDAAYNEAFEATGDGVINLFDFAEFRRNYGSTLNP